MRTLIRLCRSVMKKNKGFTAGLLIMSVLSVAIAFLGANFGTSATDTVMGYIEDCGLPDTVFTTEFLPEDIADQIGSISGVRTVSPRLVCDARLTDGESAASVRLFLWDPDAPFRHTVHDGTLPAEGMEQVLLLSQDFAEKRMIRAGDQVSLETSAGVIPFTVGAVVSNPETLSCAYDGMSAYEYDTFGYAYLREKDMNLISGVEDLANQWLVWLDDDLTETETEDALARIRPVFGGSVLSEVRTEDSEGIRSIQDDLGTIDVLCSFIPPVIWLISLGFGFIFIRIIVENRRKTIGLLRALGYSVGRVVRLFVFYTVLINIAAMILGIPLGYLLLKTCVRTVAAVEGITEITLTLRYGLTAIMLLAVFGIGIASALLSSRAIAKTDPCLAYGGTENLSVDPPAWLTRIRTGAFFKISLVSVYRSRRRQIIGALCITACVISICMGLEGVMTLGYPIDAVFGERYRYDLFVRNVDGETASALREMTELYEPAEPLSWFMADLSGKSVRVSTLTENSELTVVMDAEGNRIFPGDGVIVDEMWATLAGIRVGDQVTLGGTTLPVTGIAREIMYNVMYVSPETAASMGHGETNAVLLRLMEGISPAEAKAAVSAVDGEAYIAEWASQKASCRKGFRAMRTVMFIFAVLGFGIGSLLILNMTMIDFGENRRRYAVLRALGTPVRRLRSVSFVENLFRVVPGIALACPLCHGCISVLLGLLSSATRQYVFVDYTRCMLLACVVPLVYVLLGTALSSVCIRRMDFCAELNEVE